VPDVPGGLEGRVPFFPLAGLFEASANTPVNQEILYLNPAEVDINLEMGGRRIFRHRPGISGNSQVHKYRAILQKWGKIKNNWNVYRGSQK
jgi:hypothetical protein